ncbi:MAG: agmatine deiminase family protein [Paludibacter sp.]|nr:agmatine deiminase family protein [Paludibacter sp.]
MTRNFKKYLPAEWADQQFVLLTWPHAGTDWAYMLDEVNECFVNIAKAIIKYEDLLIVAPDINEVKSLLGDIDYSHITFAEMQTNDTWARDHGGITVFEEGKRVIYDFTFNGWGMKFAANYDNQITRTLFEKGIFNNFKYRNCMDFILEGGSIESDGNGTLLTTAECLLSDNRNNLSRDEVEQRLKDYFAIEKVLWLNHGYLAGDDTDSHVDTLARLCPDNTIVYVKCKDESDEHYAELKLMEEELKCMKNLEGKPFRLIELPMADAIIVDNERLPATYANFLIINGAVLLPVYSSPKDEIAIIQLQKAFPNREIITINCNALIKQHGSLHCVTMQYPL